jgi:DNA-binding GntR family transcriptional regulator
MAKIEHQPLNDRAYEEILKGLTNGLFAPMQPLVIRSLAEAYGISATPVREALQRLVAERLLVVLPNRSIVVPPMTVEKFEQLLPVRVAIEGMATELATPHFTRSDVARLRRLMERIAETTNNYDAKTYLKLNREFHFSIYEKSGNEELLHVIEGLWLKVGPVFTGLFDNDYYRQHANDEHANIVDAIARQDAASARAFMERDLTVAAQSLLPLLRQASGA